MSDKELLWVEKEFAEKVKQAESVSAQASVVDEILQYKKRNMEYELQELEENMLVFKSVCLNFRKELDKVADLEDEKLQTIIDRTCDIHSKVKQQSKEIAKGLQPITETLNNLESKLNKLSDKIDGINLYKVSNLLNSLERINTLDENSKDMFKFLVQSYTKTEGEVK